MNFNNCLLSIIVSLFVAGNATGQSDMNSSDVEQKSYRLYLDKNWHELIAYGKKVMDAGFDYYYLRMRIGIAYYELGKYRLAPVHFKKALGFNASDETALEYLYYSYLFSGNSGAARLTAGNFTPGMKKRLGVPKKSCVDFIYSETGIKFSSIPDQIGNMNYYNFGLNHFFGKRLSYYHNISVFNQDLWQYNDPTNWSKLNIIQYHYNGNTALQLSRAWLLATSFYFMNIHAEGSILRFKPPQNGTYQQWDWDGDGTPNPMDGCPNQAGPSTNKGCPLLPAPVDTVASSLDFAAGLVLDRKAAFFDLGVFTGFSNMSDSVRWQGGGYVTYYPNGNGNLFFTFALNRHSGAFNGAGSTMPFMRNGYTVPKISATAKIASRLWLTVLLSKGNEIMNITGSMLSPINNSADITMRRFSLLATVPVSAKINLYGLFLAEEKKDIHSLFYKFNTFLTGLKINL